MATSAPEDLRFEETVDLELTTPCRDADDPHLRVRPSVVVFPAWGFGTESEVSVAIPSGYDVRVDGDQLTEADGGLLSGPIADPAAWLALVTAIRPADYTTVAATVPLERHGGPPGPRLSTTMPGARSRSRLSTALPLLEQAIGLPYPRVGELVLSESVASASGFAETASSATEIQVAFDRRPSPRCTRRPTSGSPRGSSSRAGFVRGSPRNRGTCRDELDVAPPFDPAEATAAPARLPARHWRMAEPAADAFGYAASWALVSDRSARSVRTRSERCRAVASSIGLRRSGVDADPPADGRPAAGPFASRRSRSPRGGRWQTSPSCSGRGVRSGPTSSWAGRADARDRVRCPPRRCRGLGRT